MAKLVTVSSVMRQYRTQRAKSQGEAVCIPDTLHRTISLALHHWTPKVPELNCQEPLCARTSEGGTLIGKSQEITVLNGVNADKPVAYHSFCGLSLGPVLTLGKLAGWNATTGILWKDS